jgi:regulator of protease activity HflC (stomatin/prohibitin superfamily)
MKKIIGLIVMLMFGALVLSGCSGVNTQPDEVALEINGGALRATSIGQCYNPSTKAYDAWGNTHPVFPAGQRDFDFRGGEGAEHEPFDVVSKDIVTMKVSGVASFYLNTDCDTLKSFYKNIGIKFQPSMEDGKTTDVWQLMLNKYMASQIDKALDAASKKYGYEQLYSDPNVKETWEDTVATLAQKNITDYAKGNYFIDFTFNINTPEPPDEIVKALNAKQQAVVDGEAKVAAAVADNEAAKAQNETLITQNQGLKLAMQELGLSGPEGLQVYTYYLAVKDGQVPFITVPEGSILNIPSGTN